MANLSNKLFTKKNQNIAKTAVAVCAIVACLSLFVITAVYGMPTGNANEQEHTQTTQVDTGFIKGLDELDLLADDQKEEFAQGLKNYLVREGYSGTGTVQVYKKTEKTADGVNIYFQILADGSYHACTYIPDSSVPFTYGKYTSVIPGINDSPTVTDATGSDTIPLYDHQTLAQWFGTSSVNLNEAFMAALPNMQLTLSSGSATIDRKAIEQTDQEIAFLVNFKDGTGADTTVRGHFDPATGDYSFEKLG